MKSFKADFVDLEELAPKKLALLTFYGAECLFIEFILHRRLFFTSLEAWNLNESVSLNFIQIQFLLETSAVSNLLAFYKDASRTTLKSQKWAWSFLQLDVRFRHLDNLITIRNLMRLIPFLLISEILSHSVCGLGI